MSVLYAQPRAWKLPPMARLPVLSWIGNAAAAVAGTWGSVTRRARESGCSRQTIYQHGCRVIEAVQESQQAGPSRAKLLAEVTRLRSENQQLWEWLDETIEFPQERREKFACTASAMGLSVTQIGILLAIVLGRCCPARSTLGEWILKWAQKAGEVLRLMDQTCHQLVRMLCIDEIFCRRIPVLMAVEPLSMAWLVGQRGPDRRGATWHGVLTPWTALEYVVGDGGSGIRSGVEQLQKERQESGGPVAMNLDVFHTKQEASRVLRQKWQQAEVVWDKAVAKEREVEQLRQQGHNTSKYNRGLSSAWDKARDCFESVDRQEKAWQQAAAALAVFDPDGRLNDRARAEAQIAKALPELAGAEWAKTRRSLQDRRCLTFLDRLHEQLQQAEPNVELRDALVHLWRLRRHRPRKPEGSAAAHLAEPLQRVICAKLATSWQAAYRRVAEALRQAVRASSVVECMNSVVRMHQARHRHLTQPLLDLKRLYWNCRPFREGKRRKACPYALLRLRLPTFDWWTLLNTPSADLAQQLSTA
jgi:hypothetical protein